jgi:RHS repeat-associated protein
VTYSYDAFGNLLEEDVWTQQSGSTTVTRYGNDGGNTWAAMNGTNALQTRYLNGDQVDQVFARVSSGGTAAWYLTDWQGSVRNLTDGTGTLKDTISYDGFGNVLSESSPTFGDSLKYAGGQVDSATGLARFGRRWYDPKRGDWTSQDPTLFGGGDTNLYRYTFNDPTNLVDPSGLFGQYGIQGEAGGGTSQGQTSTLQYMVGTPTQYTTGGYMIGTPDAAALYVAGPPAGRTSTLQWTVGTPTQYTTLPATVIPGQQSVGTLYGDASGARQGAPLGTHKLPMLPGTAQIALQVHNGTAIYYYYNANGGLISFGTFVGRPLKPRGIIKGTGDYLMAVPDFAIQHRRGFDLENARRRKQGLEEQSLVSGLLEMEGQLALEAGSGAWDGTQMVANHLGQDIQNGIQAQYPFLPRIKFLDDFNDHVQHTIKENGGLYSAANISGRVGLTALELAIGAKMAGAGLAAAEGEAAVAAEEAVVAEGEAALGAEEATAGQAATGEAAMDEAASEGLANCFPAGTLVGTPAGLRLIEAIRAGEEVWAFDLVASRWRPCRVAHVFRRPYQAELVLITVAGETIESTYRHVYWVSAGEDLLDRPRLAHLPSAPEGATTPGRWVDAVDVRVGDGMLLRDGRTAAVQSVQCRPLRGDVYNLEVDDLHCYAVGGAGVLVHNVSPGEGTPPRGGAAPATRGMGDIGSHAPVNPTTALSAAEQWLGPGYSEIAPGVYRSADGLRQFRMTTSDRNRSLG